MAENARQMLLHLTSRGPNVRTTDVGGTRFTNMSQQPINDVNRFGLLHYSIPKVMDFVDDSNRRFEMNVQFYDGKKSRSPLPCHRWITTA